MLSSQTGGIDTSLGASARLKPRPLPARYGMPWSLSLLAADLLIVLLAGLASQRLTHQTFATLPRHEGGMDAALFGFALWILIFERAGMYRRTFSANARDEAYSALAASALAVVPPVAITLLLPTLVPYRHVLLSTIALATVGISGARFAAHGLRLSFLPKSVRHIAIVGTPDRVAALLSDLSLGKGDSVLRFPVERFDDEIAEAWSGGDLTKLEWLKAALAAQCDEVIVTEALPGEIMPTLLRLMEPKGVMLALAPVRIRPYACEYSVRRDGGLALLYTRSLAICTPGAELFRRLMDLVLVVPALVVLSPFLGLIALAVLIDSGRPILYRQVRVGRLGAEFEVLKFRTMRPDAESLTGPVWARNGETRTTRIGRFLRRMSLDELPQLINVLRGEMSIIGPRPERPFYVEQFRKMFRRYD
jgi:hypothetical protein